MAVYRGKYILKGLDRITPEMERDLDLAYEVCASYGDSFPCEMCGRCCHQPNIAVLPGEVDSLSAASGIPLDEFVAGHLRRSADGGFLLKKTRPCEFLGADGLCTIWKGRPEICRDFPYAVSMFMSRVYIAITDPRADIIDMISYMDGSWPCTAAIRGSIASKVEEARAVRSRDGAS
ncbi:MAG: YkgJ family cysteine cluster protein [Candidatus Methanoplasma sp.]|jgi:Fe-S-cluster containining protein|nr:YkgJ family cysteine cluster protein [Candidatus Methanoplasma sp.]